MLDFVEEENEHLIVCNEEGDVVKDVQCIIYPGIGTDMWWDHAQLLMQVDKAIEIFEEVHPNCIALFVFDQSSAHTSLRPDALHAFDMNTSGKVENTFLTFVTCHKLKKYVFGYLIQERCATCTILFLLV